MANAIQFACFENHALPPLPSHIYPASLNARKRRKKRIIVRGRVCWRRLARRWANWVGGACEKKGGEGEAESNSNPGGCKARFVQAKKKSAWYRSSPTCVQFFAGKEEKLNLEIEPSSRFPT